MNISELHEITGQLIKAGASKRKVCVSKGTFTHPLEAAGCEILPVELAELHSYELMDDDGGFTDDAETSLVLLGNAAPRERISSAFAAVPGSDGLREAFASEMMRRGLATGHGDTLADLHAELWWQFDEIRNRQNKIAEERPRERTSADTQNPIHTETRTPVGVPPPATGSMRFPRRPERDERGIANPYPGAVTYSGVGAVFFHEDLGEVVILAPSFEALKNRAARWMPEHTLDPAKCRNATLKSSPNKTAEERPRERA